MINVFTYLSRQRNCGGAFGQIRQAVGQQRLLLQTALEHRHEKAERAAERAGL
jgi:hypothetical protein